MSIFKTSKVIPVAVADLAPVAREVMKHFAEMDYEVSGEQITPHRWEIALHKGGTFQAITGMKTALRIRIEAIGASTQVEAGIGLLDSQGISTAVAVLAFSPVLVTQTWGLIKQMKLDEEVITVVEQALLAGGANSSNARFCHECGASVTQKTAFCSACGVRL
jgi:hypothetical protein